MANDLRQNAPSRLNVGLVGGGYWGPNLARVLADHEDTRLTWLCDRAAGPLSRLARRYPAAQATTRFDDVLSDPDLDAVFIATPVGTHSELATRSLDAGKHTFVEKPLARSIDEAERLTSLAEELRLTLLCGHTFTYSPAVQTVREILERGELGDLYFISSSRVNLGPYRRDVSVIWDLAPHDFSMLSLWLGSLPSSVRAVGRGWIQPDIQDIAFVTLNYPGDLIVNVELSWLAPSKLRRTVLVGRNKMVVYEDGSAEPVRVFDSGVVYRDPETFGEYHLSYRTGTITSPKIEPVEPLVAEVDDFVAAVRIGEPMTDAAELALGVVTMVEAAQLSLENGGAEVRVDHRQRVSAP